MSVPQVRITDPHAVPLSGLGRVKAYVELTKPRIIELLLITTVPAMVVAAGRWPSTWLVLATLVGGTLSAGGANAINNVIDRDIDQIMRRTKGRPIPTSRIKPRAALAFGAALGIAGFLWLWVTANLLAAVLSTAGLLFYVFVYTMILKRTTTQNIVVGGAAGSVPALVGWAAVTGEVAAAAWVMFAIIFFWTPPHFWAMLPVVVGRARTMEQIELYTIVLVGVSLLLYPTGAVGWVYLVAAAALGGWLYQAARRLHRRPGESMRFFGFSNLYLAALFIMMAVDAIVL